MSAESEALAARMVRPGGSGTIEDSLLVQRQLSLLPAAILASLIDRKIGVVACRSDVLDYRPDMATAEDPRGYPSGKKWTDVPGCYLPVERNVLVATVLRNGIRTVPVRPDLHGSWNLVVHETMHADDYDANRLRSQNANFLAARGKDIDALTRIHEYMVQPGVAGCEETYAETAARFFAGDPDFQGKCPNVHEFWQQTQLPVPPGAAVLTEIGSSPYIGTARREMDGTIVLNLRISGETAVGGHKLIRVSPDSPEYAAMAEKMKSAASDTEVFGDAVLLKPF